MRSSIAQPPPAGNPMPEPLDDDYLKKTQRIITAVPKGPWEIEPSEHGLPDQVGPICFLETWVDKERLPVVEFISFAREALPRYVGEVAQLRSQVADLERLLRRRGVERDGCQD